MKYFIFFYLWLLPASAFSQEITPPAVSKQGYFNPDISVIVDTFYQRSNNDITETLSKVSGFANPLNSEYGPDEGINMNELEIFMSANIDPYFKGWAIPVLEPDGAEMEEAVIQTTALPYGLQLKAGKFFSDFGRVNPQHLHFWDFSDLPLIYRLTLGVEAEGLNEPGVQVSWLVPTDFYLLTGLEVLQGTNELIFNYIGEEPLPKKSGPRVLVGWFKLAPEIQDVKQALQFGSFFGRGVHQTILDNDNNGLDDQWLSGTNKFWGIDFVYKYDDTRAYREGDIIVQGEYLQRRRILEVAADNRSPLLVGQEQDNLQDGYYLQVIYGMLPRWRIGLRWDQVGLANRIELPDGSEESPDTSTRVTAMIDWSFSEYSRLRLQYAHGNYELAGPDEKISQVFLQFQVSLGAHGAHKF